MIVAQRFPTVAWLRTFRKEWAHDWTITSVPLNKFEKDIAEQVGQHLQVKRNGKNRFAHD